ncbi:hypothetical protein R3W88_028917 [Solanum pinnatisectum]|uniref:peroxidase n=1 Tax=Solanum pinnatisectum TaxID=50273 RepID=A0AAV9K423_9SOLN|nr:hypothetical protein R3W88_028917 [Solanum pinnatisectum]
MDSKGINLSALALFACLILSFSSYTCPYAEHIVQNVVNRAVSLNPGIAAGLVRLHFHDCFVRVRMSVDEMVTLSGAYSIGIAHCGVFASHLYPQNNQQNLPIDPEYADFLKSICPPEALTNGTGAANPANLDALTPNRLDNRYYLALKSQKGLMISDQALLANPTTAKLVNYNARCGSIWSRKFAAAMIHMGTLDVLTGRNGEIRRNCHFVN